MSEAKISDDELKLSPTVRDAMSRFSQVERVSAVAITNAILDLYNHRSEYAGGKASALKLNEVGADGARRPAQDWLEEMRSLYDARGASELHGRLVIIGLGLLDTDLQEQLNQDGFRAALELELTPPLGEILTEKGQRLWHGAAQESLSNLPDNALENATEDKLGRAAYAEFLARRLDALQNEETSYILNIYGPWGSGKSTVLNFLKEKLEGAERNWLVVDFNAWQQQRIGPPWWSLMDRVFQAGINESLLVDEDRLDEFWWRLTLGRNHIVITIVGLVILWISVLLVFPIVGARTDGQSSWASFVSFADGLGKLFALAGTFWLIAKALGQSLLPGSASAARNFMDSSQDPMKEVEEHFGKLVRRIGAKGKRVVVFIDDLDRCQSEYAVELMEGVQTLFRPAKVVFVIAADRRWLHAVYEEVYENLTSTIREPGRPLGTQFLEKAFQLSAPLPGISKELRKAYWEHLLQLDSQDVSLDDERARASANEQLDSVKSEGQINQFVAESQGLPFNEQRIRREEAVKALAGQEIGRRTEHALRPFAPLLRPNPRAMKRLVNAYSIHRALSILSQVDLERKPLALWTILAMRWPALAELLMKRPELVEKIGQKDGEHGVGPSTATALPSLADDQEPGNQNDLLSGVPESLRPLFSDENVIAVVKRNDLDVELTIKTVKRCAELYA